MRFNQTARTLHRLNPVSPHGYSFDQQIIPLLSRNTFRNRAKWIGNSIKTTHTLMTLSFLPVFLCASISFFSVFKRRNVKTWDKQRQAYLSSYHCRKSTFSHTHAHICALPRVYWRTRRLIWNHKSLTPFQSHLTPSVRSLHTQRLSILLDLSTVLASFICRTHHTATRCVGTEAVAGFFFHIRK